MKYFLPAAVAAALFTFGTTPVQAQEDEEDIVGSLTAEETKEVWDFGRGVGKTFHCVKDEKQLEMQEDVRMVFNFVAQDMGTDAAYLYAVAVGYGANESAEEMNCEKLLTTWVEARESFGLAEEGQ